MAPSHRVTPRALAVGAILVVAVSLGVAFGENVVSRGGSSNAILLGATHIPAGALGGLLFLLMAVALLRRISRRIGLRPHETLTVYVMMCLGAILSSFGLMTMLLPSLVGVNYFASESNKWWDLFYKYIPEWAVPFDPRIQDVQSVSRDFYEGLRPGQPVPWDAWAAPLLSWSAIALLMFALMMCLMAILRRQWVDNEKLSFPLVQLPLEMIGERTAHLFFRSKAMWAGFAIPMLVHSLNGLHLVVPAVPQVPIIKVLNENLRPLGKPWSDLTFTPIIIAFSVIGLSVLLPQEVCFSVWFFLLLSRVQELIASSVGARLDNMPVYPAKLFVGYQSVGACVAMSVSFFLLARRHLAAVWSRTFGRGYPMEDADELMPYRSALFGALMSLALILLWCTFAGMNPLVGGLIFVAFIFFVSLVLSRCVAEIGLLMLQPLFRPIDVLAVFTKRSALGAQNLTILSFLDGVFFRDPRNIMPAFMDGMKMADGVRLHRRSLVAPFVIAIVVAMMCGYVFQLKIIYHYGGLRLNSWFFMANPRLYFQESAARLQVPEQFDYRAPIWFAVGMIVTFGLYAMRARFVWWPLHPIGYTIGAAWPGIVYWFSYFVGWVAKTLLIRYGGMKVFRTSRPFFLGLILGEFSAAILWVILSASFDLPRPSIPLT
ncbi:MAG: DUF6785 family protein [Armatimonadota bacterium]